MSKPYTEADFSDQVDADLNWRRKELSDIKLAIRNTTENSRPALLRALITMTYAHWEGYVRTCATKYFQHLYIRKKLYRDFEKQIFINSYLIRLDAFFQNKHNIKDRCKFIEDIMDARDNRFSYINPQLIDTKSNLNTDVIKDLCTICGIDYSPFEEKRAFIDIILLKRRNAIAHGQQEVIGESEIDIIVADAIELMTAFKNLLENKVYTRTYLAA